jgi:DNA topoisomerase-1
MSEHKAVRKSVLVFTYPHEPEDIVFGPQFLKAGFSLGARSTTGEAHIRAYTRRLPSGGVAPVHEHIRHYAAAEDHPPTPPPTPMPHSEPPPETGEPKVGKLWQPLLDLEDGARKRIKESLGRLSSGIDPTLLGDLAIIGAVKMVRGSFLMADWTKAMLADVGEKIRPHLPEIHRAAKKVLARHMETAQGHLPRTERLMDIVRQGMPAARWYEGSKKELQEIFGDDADLMIDFLAACSTGSDVTSNVALALKAYRQYKTGEEFKGYLPTVIVQLKAAVAGKPFGGPKIENFTAALKGDTGGVAVDRWVARAFNLLEEGQKRPTKRAFDFIKQWVTEEAKACGLTPRQFQAAIWSGIKFEQTGDGSNEAYETHIKRRMAKDPKLAEFIQATRKVQASAPPVAKAVATVHAHTSHSKTGKLEQVRQFERKTHGAKLKIPAGSPHPTLPHLPPSTKEDRDRVKELGGHKPVPPTSWALTINPTGAEAKEAPGGWKAGQLAKFTDASGKPQYIYPANVREQRQAANFEKVKGLADVLGELRDTWERDMQSPGLNRSRVAAAVMHLVDLTTMRIGGEANATREEDEGEATFGAASLRKEHVKLGKDSVVFSFAGKHHQEWDRTVTDPQIVGVVRELMALPGERLWQYEAKGGLEQMDDGKVRAYMKSVSNGFTPKDLRTYHATRMTAERLADVPVPEVKPPDPAAPPKKRKTDPVEDTLNTVIKSVAETLGNKWDVCKNNYVNPGVCDAWRKGHLVPEMWKAISQVGHSEEAFHRLLRRLAVLLRQGKITDTWPEAVEKALDPSYDPKHPEECCPHCGACQERDSYSKKCNRCGKPWPVDAKGHTVRKAVRTQSTGEEEPDWEHPFSNDIDHDEHIGRHTAEWQNLRKEYVKLALAKDPAAQAQRQEVVRKMRLCSVHRNQHILHKYAVASKGGPIRPAMKAVASVHPYGLTSPRVCAIMVLPPRAGATETPLMKKITVRRHTRRGEHGQVVAVTQYQREGQPHQDAPPHRPFVPGASERLEALHDEEDIVIERKANPKYMWEIATKKTYGDGNYPVLCVREAVQNARDAVAKAMRDGQIPKGHGQIEVTTDKDTHSVTIRDNGIGMDRDTFNNVFMALGEPGGKEVGDLGGFGWAKAVILGSSKTDDWTVRSRGYIFHSHEISDGKKHSFRAEEPIQGTEFVIRNLENWDWESERLIRTFLSLSELNTPYGKIRVTLNGRDVSSPLEGKRGVRLESFEEDWGPGNRAKVRAFRNPSGGGSIFVRFGGLMQWQDRIWTNRPIGKDVVIDIDTDNPVSSSDYPFMLSRSGFQYSSPANDRIREIKSYFERETVTAGDEKPKYEVDYYDNPGIFIMDEARAAGDSGAYVRASEMQDRHVWGREEDADVAVTGILGNVIGALTETLPPVVRKEVKERRVFGKKEDEALLPGDTGLAPRKTQTPAGGSAAEVQRRTRHKNEEIIESLEEMEERLKPILRDQPFKDPGVAWQVRRDRESYGRKKFSLVDNVPMLMAWHCISHMVATEYGRARLSVKPHGTGYILAGTTRAQAQNDEHIESERQYVLLNPDLANEALKKGKKKANDWVLTNYLYTMACHELAHLSNMGDGHDQGHSYLREDIAIETGHLLPMLHAVVQACFPEKGRLDRKTIEGHTEAYQKQREVSRESARRYHAREKAIKLIMHEQSASREEVLSWAGGPEKAKRMTAEEIRAAVRQHFRGY